MSSLKVVFDTSVMVAAARSRRGASFALVSQLPSIHFQLCLSVPLYLEWQSVLTRPENIPSRLNTNAVLNHLRFVASVCHLQTVYFRWRPSLPDPDDDLVLELAFAAGCRHIVTHNVQDFRGSEQLGVSVVNPAEFLKLIRAKP